MTNIFTAIKTKYTNRLKCRLGAAQKKIKGVVFLLSS